MWKEEVVARFEVLYRHFPGVIHVIVTKIFSDFQHCNWLKVSDVSVPP
jgi:hypothetical protein